MKIYRPTLKYLSGIKKPKKYVEGCSKTRVAHHDVVTAGLLR